MDPEHNAADQRAYRHAALAEELAGVPGGMMAQSAAVLASALHRIAGALHRLAAARERPQHVPGCICPAGAEGTCQAALCPRRSHPGLNRL